jgi:sugar (pentulose or hexulose) kinase
MLKKSVVAIFDIGKTNKKLFLFDEQYRQLYEQAHFIEETVDEDGFACEDVQALTTWIKQSFEKLLKDKNYVIKAVNFSAYGASFVYLDEACRVCLPLYNYLKPFPQNLQKQFDDKYGSRVIISKQTASPALGNLNSGMQLYRIKYEKPDVFKKIKYALHLPQYISYLFSGKAFSEITSIGSHTILWDFAKNYHSWVNQEGITHKLPALRSAETLSDNVNQNMAMGLGLHDSSAALIPYLVSFSEPFILLSTGTWCISLNPFNHSPLTDFELDNDCLCYLSYQGKPVKASRFFGGHEHDKQVKKLAAYFNIGEKHLEAVRYDGEIVEKLQLFNSGIADENDACFHENGSCRFQDYIIAYHQLVTCIIKEQVRRTGLIRGSVEIRHIYVDGGFSKNQVYMYLLADAFPGINVYAATIAQASALGAAMVIHKAWNNDQLPSCLIDLKLFSNNTF